MSSQFLKEKSILQLKLATFPHLQQKNDLYKNKDQEKKTYKGLKKRRPMQTFLRKDFSKGEKMINKNATVISHNEESSSQISQLW